MSEQPAPSSQAPDGVAEDFARADLEHQKAALRRLGDLGMEIVESLARIAAREAEASERDPDFKPAAITHAYDRAARGVRLSYALQASVIDQLRVVGRIEKDAAEADRLARAAEARARQAQARANDPVNVRKCQIAKVVDGIIADAHDGDGEAQDRHVREAERLRDHEVLEHVLDRPASEVIADICRLLGLEPNWEGLAFEAWAVEERESGKLGAPLQSPPPWTGRRPGIRGRLLKAEPPLAPEEDLPLQPDPEDLPPEPEIAQAPPPYIPPPDPDILPGYPVGLPGEYPPERPGRRPRPMPPPTNYTRGFI
jgi:hypothetical protein